jgi:4-diphosphocytidyl-2-C-methyl-D-erythritol kinase
MVVVEKGYAKINLGLEVIEKRPDNYHELAMIMTTINLYDELYFEDVENGAPVIAYDKPNDRAIESDLIYKAYILLKEKYKVNKGLKVRVIKRIPEQAGLGGGSADAAATLRALNELWRLGLSLDELACLGLQVGSDVPFCVYNKTAKVTGRGENIEFIDECPYLNLVFVFPDFKAATAEVFSSFKVHSLNKGKTEALRLAIAVNNIQDIAGAVFNDLERSRHYHDINAIKEILIESGALGAAMTGSGSAVYGICHSQKHAQAVLQKCKRISEERLKNAKKYTFTIAVTRSSRRPTPAAKRPGGFPRSRKTLGTGEAKAYGMITLFYRRVLDDYQMIITPVILYDNIHVEKTEGTGAEVSFDDRKNSPSLTAAVRTIATALGYGLRVRIRRNADPRFALISDENYLSAIITALSEFGEDTERLYALFDKTVRLYRDYRTVFYDSKSGEITPLSDAVFCYAALVPFQLDRYQPPRYTRQIDNDPAALSRIKTAIVKRNFYEMASAMYNGVSPFDARKITAIKGYDFCGRLEEISINNRAGGFLIAPGGQYAIALFRLQKYAEQYVNYLKRKHRLPGIVTSLKSEVKHRLYHSVYLQTIADLPEKVEYDVEIDDSSPFENFFSGTEFEFDEYDRSKSGRRVKEEQRTAPRKESDLEGMFYLHSGGSIFKQYDFIDIARYFELLHDKHIVFEINGKIVPVRFDVSQLPHILGMHYLDSTIQGRAGFERLINGEISYNSLKRSNPKILKEIKERTHSSVLIINDILHNRMYDICCFDRSIILKGNSKNEKFEYGITRRLATTMFRRQNLLGIGKESNAEKYFFQTSYIWNVPASIGKKDSLKISIHSVEKIKKYM